MAIQREAVVALRGECASPFILTCEHASCRVPAPWGTLGLAQEALRDHIGWDLGAEALTRELSDSLDAAAFLSGYSRLFVECNRLPDAWDFVAPNSAGITVPGNQHVDTHERMLRKSLAFSPFHDAITSYLDHFVPSGVKPVVIAVHSFTPRLGQTERPWHIGVLWKRDSRFARRLHAELVRHYDGLVGLNEPYDAGQYQTMVLDCHALPRQLAHVIIEVRQDLLASTERVGHIGRLLTDSIRAVIRGEGKE